MAAATEGPVPLSHTTEKLKLKPSLGAWGGGPLLFTTQHTLSEEDSDTSRTSPALLGEENTGHLRKELGCCHLLACLGLSHVPKLMSTQNHRT